ncbi:MAG: DnaJ domain-containing protein [Deltaproteobacteria bacterium]|nr:DnaJ domain-containing protein [Deltaproteobacteria bacterium]
MTGSALPAHHAHGLLSRRSIFLRTVGGELIGPIDHEACSALLETAIIGPETPASLDGRVFSTLQSLDAREPEPTDDAEIENATIDLGTTVLRGILKQAVHQASGYVRVAAERGEITLALKDGKIVQVQTSIIELDLPRFLEESGVASRVDLREASALASASGTDLGATLISLGRIPPHVYAEALLAWAMKVIATALLEQHRQTLFEAADVEIPAIPIALDRLGIFMDAVRAGMSKDDLEAYARPHLRCAVIPASADGLTTEAFKLRPRELRVMNSVDGLRTVQDLLDQIGKTHESRLSVIQVLFFAEQAGFIVYSEDRTEAQMFQRTKELHQKHAELEPLNFMQILDVSPESSDSKVRSQYADLVKLYHPDRLPPDATTELVNAQRAVFERVQEAFNALETEAARLAYAKNLSEGTADGTSTNARVQDALRAETVFKKAQILVRVRKYDEALAHIEEAIALNGAEPEFRMYRPYVQYLATTQGRRDANLARIHRQEIAPLLEKHPTIALGHLCTGHLYRQASEDARALPCFEKVLEFDPQHPEALEQIRTLSRRLRDTQDIRKRRS